MNKRIAIISNYKEKCGIAQYTDNIIKGYKRHNPDVTVDVLPVNTKIVKSQRRKDKKSKDLHWKDICEKAKGYDAINIQFENGIYGNNNNEILKNLAAIFNSHSNVTVTMHTVMYNNEGEIGIINIAKLLASLKLKSAIHCLFKTISGNFLDSFMSLISKYRNIKLIVHTHREKSQLKYLYNFDKIYVHPLSFTDVKERTEPEKRDLLNKEFQLRESDKVIAIYGFISSYKGHMTAIDALKKLPYDYKLLIVGASHPGSIANFNPIDDYLADLLGRIEHLKLSKRVVFAGSVSDEMMMDIMRSVDVSIFPYVEVGQSASGPATMQLELGGRILYSNAHVFTQLDTFAGHTLRRFDIGNFLELASCIERYMKEKKEKDNEFNKHFSLKSNIEFYTKTLLEV